MKTTPEHDRRMAKTVFASVYPYYIKKVESKGRTNKLEPKYSDIIFYTAPEGNVSIEVIYMEKTIFA